MLWFDFDLDSRLDLLLANGHLEPEIKRVDGESSYAQTPQLFRNVGPAHSPELVVVGANQVGPDLFQPMVGRGLSYADYDGDGDLDLLFATCGGRARLLCNDRVVGPSDASQGPSAWIRLRLVGRTVNRDAIGAWIEVECGGRTMRRRVMPTRGYLSQVELPVTIGMGDESLPLRVRIRWPGGQTQWVNNVHIGETTVVLQSRT